jgi:hypothetical protein
VILVAMRDDDGPHLVLALEHILHVGMTMSMPSMSLSGNMRPAVHDQQLAVVLDDHHVLADLADPTQGDDSQDIWDKWAPSRQPK